VATENPVQQAFANFEREKARVPIEQINKAKEVHPQIRSVLERELSGEIVTFLSGSYARKTQAVKLKDVDMIVVFKDPDGTLSKSADRTLEYVRKAVSKCDLVRRTHKSVRALKMFLHDEEFTVDVVPALESPDSDDGLLLCRRLPDEGYDDFTRANPKRVC
jgi:predicted nucleotidyltransferase